MSRSILLVALLVSMLTSGRAEEKYLTMRDGFKTHLTKKGPSPQSYEKESPPAGVQEVRYPSAGRNLKAWVARPTGDGTKLPVLVYFHGGFAFGADDFLECIPFLKAGFVVMTPMLRGENGNPGAYELYLGEVDDARAAIRWIASQDFVDRERIYTFGHSAGGVVSALVSLFDDCPVRLTGSSGGLYGPGIFAKMDKNEVPFDPTDPVECRLRSLIGNVRDMKSRHFAYVGAEDKFQEYQPALRETGTDGKLKIAKLPGDHYSSLQESFQRYLAVVRNDLNSK